MIRFKWMELGSEPYNTRLEGFGLGTIFGASTMVMLNGGGTVVGILGAGFYFASLLLKMRNGD